ncbi:insulinase family protein [Bacteroidales bacterium OttesenSCG-928-A17]|nr:insulinase family protein [Bacteroidales bacterium OttesenSCG-928-A17]
MKNKKIYLLAFCMLITANLFSQGLNSFKLPNGLSVYIWEDPTASDVFGIVAVNVGAKEDPEQYTGLAHYLEHLLFKGTQRIGALDWEKEKPIYEQIIAKYDEMAATTDPLQREEISKEINRLTLEAAKYNLNNEFSGLTQSIGGEGLNAGTGYDYTVYYNSFPPGEIYKWLHLNSERLINPVFRGFQQELETVYEEYNKYQDELGARTSEYISSIIFPGTPYARSIIGLPEHLKNPQLSQLITFYDKWYVPSNMALILTGNVKTKEVISLINQTFGRLENKPTPEKKTYSVEPVKGKKESKTKMARYPQLVLSFPGITSSSEDDIVLDICTSILSNSSRTGLIDKLILDGDLLSGAAYAQSQQDAGSIIIAGIPYYDANQRRFESLKSVEKTLLKEVKNLQEGKFDESLVHSIKSEMIRMYDLQMESTENKAMNVAMTFLSGKDMSELLEYKELVAAVNMDEIKAFAKKYFGDNYYAIYLEEGKPAKAKELEKPKIDPIVPVRGASSQYAQEFRLFPVKYMKPDFADINKVEVRQINDLSILYYTHNPENEIFTLTLKYGVGTEKMPKLDMAVSLMNNAGIMGQMDAQEVKKAFSELGASARYSVNDSYLTITMNGFEQNLQPSCKLLTHQVLLPSLDEKQLGNIQGTLYQGRRMEKNMTETMNSALLQYLLYQDKSGYIDRLTLEDIQGVTISNLTGEFQRATGYEAEIHYVGALPVDEVLEILQNNLPLREGEMKSESPLVKDRVAYAENTIFFLPNSDAQQSAVYFYIQGDEYDNAIDPCRNAFNQYFSGGFSALVLQEIREYRSMAYSAGGGYSIPPLEEKKAFFLGSVSTQADKTLDAIEIYMDLLTNMPEYPDRMEDIKTFLKQTSMTEKPHFRNASQIYQSWKQRGYDKSPAETNLKAFETMTFDELLDFYKTYIKGRPVTIGICGNPKMIDLKELEKYGKVTRLNTSKVFSDK